MTSEDRSMAIDKVVALAYDALRDVIDGSSLAVGGFGLCGIRRC
jgi:3-oxoacid CoA-transferase subunit A